MKIFTSWRPPLLWRAILLLSRLVTASLSRLEVTGHPGDIGRGAILAVNHIGNFDPIALCAACSKLGLAPRFLAMEELFVLPVAGTILRRAGQIRVDRHKPTAPQALTDAITALGEGSLVVVYPEGRIGLDPGMWPERGKTGTGRLALATGAPIIAAAIWGAHEVLPYSSPRGLIRAVWRALRTRPRVKVHFGRTVDLSDIDTTRPGAAQRITDRVIDAITDELVPLRTGEPDVPRYQDPTRPPETRRSHRRRSVP